MIWILYVVGALAALVLLMALIGLTLRPDHVATRDAVIAAPPAAVYALIRDVAAYPSWRTDVKKVELLPPIDGKRAFREHGSNGPIPFVVDEDVAPSRLVTRIADDKLPFGGRWVITVAPEGAGSRVTVTEEGVVKNPVFRFLSRTVFSLVKTQERWLHNLAAHFASRGR